MQARLGTIAEVVSALEAIDADLPTRDGIAWFTKLYLEVTRAIHDAVRRGVFADPETLALLDATFAELFLDAVAAAKTGSEARAWRPVFASRADPRIAPLQFALAGMNAHINRDLPLALARTCARSGRAPERDSPLHADFERVNGVIAVVEPRVRAWFETGFVGELGRDFAGLDEHVSAFSITTARDTAWTNAEILWGVRESAHLTARFLLVLDRIVGLAGRGLLVPLD